jgi:hypothetical protein
VRVHFTLATPRQTRDIFVRFYDDAHALKELGAGQGAVSGESASEKRVSLQANDDKVKVNERGDNGVRLDSGVEKGEGAAVGGTVDMAASTHESTYDMADRFAAAVCPGLDDDAPSGVSVAQLQAYLLAHKLDAQRAVREAGEWAREVVA